MNIQDRINQAGIGATIRKVENNPHMRPGPNASQREVRWYQEASHWRLYLRNAGTGERMQITFTMGSGHNGRPPTVEEVMSAVLSDASYALSCRDYIDFATETGIEPDSHARKTFDTIVAQTDKLRTFLGGKDTLSLWLYGTDNDV